MAATLQMKGCTPLVVTPVCPTGRYRLVLVADEGLHPFGCYVSAQEGDGCVVGVADEGLHPFGCYDELRQVIRYLTVVYTPGEKANGSLGSS